MPTYEYACAKCGHEFEALQSMSAAPLKTCPEDLCARKKWGRGKVRKKISAGAGLLFKGSGFYITDYRSEGYKQSAKKDSSTPAPAGGESKPAKSEAKPAAATKPETKPAKK
jgi:putative FmdB family regulatory protein